MRSVHSAEVCQHVDVGSKGGRVLLIVDNSVWGPNWNTARSNRRGGTKFERDLRVKHLEGANVVDDREAGKGIRNRGVSDSSINITKSVLTEVIKVKGDLLIKLSKLSSGKGGDCHFVGSAITFDNIGKR